MKPIKKLLSIGVAISLFSMPCFSDVVRIPLGQQGQAWNIDTPSLGLSKSQVDSIYGSPMNKTGPVGEPAIYTWEYEYFNVFFENEHVIHAVVKKMKKPAQ